MSVTVRVNVTCDGCGLEVAKTTPVQYLSAVSDVDVPGWTFFQARALCPVCSKSLSIGLGMETP